jgi:hypothetical protein
MLKRLISAYLRAFYRVHNAAPPTMQPREVVLLDGVAANTSRWLTTRGRLILTTERLIYSPFNLGVWPLTILAPRLEIELEKVSAIGPDRRKIAPSGFLGVPRFQVETAHGPTYRFQVPNAPVWEREIRNILTTRYAR